MPKHLCRLRVEEYEKVSSNLFTFITTVAERLPVYLNRLLNILISCNDMG